MVLQIADWKVRVECPGEEAMPFLPNLLPFLLAGPCAEAGQEGEDYLTVLQLGCNFPFPAGQPVVSACPDGRLIRVWLSADYCCMELRMPGCARPCRLRADRHWRQVQTDLELRAAMDYALLNDLIMLAFIYASAFKGTVLIHASCVAVADKGAMFVGPSGIGKSTHSRLWLKHIPETRLLNDDQPVLRLFPTGEVRVYGSPWSGKTPCYRQDSASLRALFRMEQALENQAVRLTPIESFRMLLGASSLIGRDAMSFSGISGTLARIAGCIPAYRLKNRPGQAAAELSHRMFMISSSC